MYSGLSSQDLLFICKCKQASQCSAPAETMTKWQCIFCNLVVVSVCNLDIMVTSHSSSSQWSFRKLQKLNFSYPSSLSGLMNAYCILVFALQSATCFWDTKPWCLFSCRFSTHTPFRWVLYLTFSLTDLHWFTGQLQFGFKMLVAIKTT